MSVSGHPDGEPGGGPMKVGLSMIDILTSFYAAVAIVSALYHRDVKNGPGQHIDLALLDCGLAALSHFAMNYLVSGEVPVRRGNGGFGGVPSQAFACADGDIFLVAGNNAFFTRLCAAISHPEITQDARFSTTAGRIENREALLVVLSDIFRARTVADWLERLDAADVPCSAVNDLPAALANPQIQHREMVQEVAHAGGVALKLLRNPIRFSKTPIEVYAAPPLIGQDTDDILGALGYGADAVAALRAAKTI